MGITHYDTIVNSGFAAYNVNRMENNNNIEFREGIREFFKLFF